MEINSQFSSDETLTNSQPPQTTEDTSTQFPNLNKNKFTNKKFIIIAIIIVVIIMALGITFFITRRDNTQEQAVTEPETATAASLAITQENFNWLNQQKDSRNLYIDYSTCAADDTVCRNEVLSSNRAFLPALWARYQNYLATNNTAELETLKNDIAQARAVILDGYTEEGYKNVIQNNSFNCLLMADLIKDETNIFNTEEKEALKRFCTESTYELNFQPMINYFYADHNGQLAALPPTLDLLNNELLASINQKIAIINNGQIATYDIATDPIYQEFLIPLTIEREEGEMVEENEATNAVELASVKGYYYFALDQIARYQLEPTQENLYLSLVLLDDFLSVYIWDQQLQTPFYADLGNCFLEKAVAAARSTLANGGNITPLAIPAYQPTFDLRMLITDDRNYNPVAACWLVQLKDLSNTDLLNEYQATMADYLITQENEVSPVFSDSIIETSFLSGLLSQSLIGKK